MDKEEAAARCAIGDVDFDSLSQGLRDFKLRDYTTQAKYESFLAGVAWAEERHKLLHEKQCSGDVKKES